MAKAKIEGYHMIKVICQPSNSESLMTGEPKLGGEFAMDGALANRILKLILSQTGVDLSDGEGKKFISHVAVVKDPNQFEMFFSLGEIGDITLKAEPKDLDKGSSESTEGDKEKTAEAK